MSVSRKDKRESLSFDAVSITAEKFRIINTPYILFAEITILSPKKLIFAQNNADSLWLKLLLRAGPAEFNPKTPNGMPNGKPYERCRLLDNLLLSARQKPPIFPSRIFPAMISSVSITAKQPSLATLLHE